MYIEDMLPIKPTATGHPGGLPTVVPDPIDIQKAGETGHRTLWVVTIIMFLSSLAIYIMAWRVPANKRLFHVLTALITTIATLSYFAMAVGDGTTWHYDIKHEDLADPLPDLPYGMKREVYWVRYVDWALTTPLLLIDLSLLAGLNGANITVAVFADLVMILAGLFSALSNSEEDRVRWGYYVIACLAFLTVVYQLGYNGGRVVRAKDKNTQRFFISIASFTLILWTLYPIIWGVSDGAFILSVDHEIVAYAVLDVLAKPAFGFWLLFTHDAMAESTFSVEGFWAHGFPTEGAIRVGEGDEGA